MEKFELDALNQISNYANSGINTGMLTKNVVGSPGGSMKDMSQDARGWGAENISKYLLDNNGDPLGVFNPSAVKAFLDPINARKEELARREAEGGYLNYGAETEPNTVFTDFTTAEVGKFLDKQYDDYMKSGNLGDNAMWLPKLQGDKVVFGMRNPGKGGLLDKITKMAEPAFALSGLGPGLSDLVGAAGITGMGGDVLSGALKGGISSFLTGGGPGGALEGAIRGGLTGGIGGTASDVLGRGIDLGDYWGAGDPTLYGGGFDPTDVITNWDDTDTGVTNTNTGGGTDVITNFDDTDTGVTGGGAVGRGVGSQDWVDELLKQTGEYGQDASTIEGGFNPSLSNAPWWSSLPTNMQNLIQSLGRGGVSQSVLTRLARGVLGGGGGGGTSDDALIRALGILGSTGLGIYGSNQQSKALEDLAKRYEAYGAPSRSRYEASMTAGFDPTTIPGYSGALDTASNALLRGLSTQGNPYGNPGGLIEANKQIVAGTALPAVQNYQTLNSNTGFRTSMNLMNQADVGAIGANRGVTAALGSGLGALTQPNSLEDILKLYGGMNSLRSGWEPV